MFLYNTQLKKLILPEYGRNVHQMVDYCRLLPDRDERNRCARTIVRIMANMFPEQLNEADFVHKLWDHLAIMSDFQLDVDYPFEVVRQENLESKPEPVSYHLEKIKFRHYGKVIERMIRRATEYPEGPERDTLVMLLANHMKKLIYQINNEDVEDAKIFNDLYIYSDGKIQLDPAVDRLHEYQVMPQQPKNTGKRKKKK